MARNRSSDRDRLLKLIDGGSEAEKELRHGPLSAGAQQARHHWFQLKEELMSRLGAPQHGTDESSKPLILVINRILIGAVLLALIYAAFDFTKIVFWPQTISKLSHEGPSAEEAQFVPPVENSKSYANLAGLFEAPIAGDTAPSQALSNDASGLKLVGVDWGGEEPVALIEDTQTGKTFFKKKGEIVHDYRVSEILRNKVVLSIGDQVVEIQ